MKFPNDFALEISGMYQSKSFWGISEFLPVSSVNAGIQKKFDKIGTFKFSVDDIFNNNNWRIRTYQPENKLNTYWSYDFHSRYVRVTYTRNFGNNRLKKVKINSGAEEEKSRVSN